MPKPPALLAYLCFSALSGPIYRFILRRRLAAGKEDHSRIGERFGKTQAIRHGGPLIWFHAASVGESLALLRPISEILTARQDTQILITTTTQTSAELLQKKLPDKAVHQYSPIDTPAATRRFLDHWHPDVAVWTESEIWPRLMFETHTRDIPMHLVNARVSPQTAARWQRWQRPLRHLLDYFETIGTQDEATAKLITSLGVSERSITVSGSTKANAAPLTYDSEAFSQLSSDLGIRTCWLAASTHPGEEDLVLEAHQRLCGLVENPLLVLVPRHPERGDAVAELASKMGLQCNVRSRGENITENCQVYLADTLGELGLWYRLSPVSFIGGSLVNVGGHNPYEPIELGSAVISGPAVFNFETVYRQLEENSGAIIVENAEKLVQAVQTLWVPANQASFVSAAREALRADEDATSRLVAVVLRSLPAAVG